MAQKSQGSFATRDNFRTGCQRPIYRGADWFVRLLGVSDGSACAIVTTPELAKSLGKENIVSVKCCSWPCLMELNRVTKVGMDLI